MKIVSVVPNSAERDFRVMKEAMTLVEAGHEVHVVGIQEAKYPSYRTTYKNNVEIYRVSHGEVIRGYKKNLKAITAGILSLILVALLLLIMPVLYRNITFDWAVNIYNYIILNLSEIVWILAIQVAGIVVVIISALYVAYKFINLIIKYTKKLAQSRSTRRWMRSLVRSYNTVINISLKRLALKNKLFEKIVELEPELIYCHEVTALPACAEAKRKLGVPLVYDAHEFYDGLEGDNAKLLSKYNEKIHSRYLKYVDKFVTVSSTILEFYNEKYPVVKGKGALLPNAVLTKELPEYDGRLHEAAKLPSSQKILLYQGGISRPRMVHEVVRAAEMMPEDWSVVLMGSGRDLEEFEALANEINKNYQKNSIKEKMTPEMLVELEELAERQYKRAYSLEMTEHEDEDEEKRNYGFNVVNYATRSYEPFLRDFIRMSSGNISKSKREVIEDKLGSARTSIIKGIDSLLGMEAKIDDISYDKAYEMAFWRIYKKYEDELFMPPKCMIIPPAPQDELHMWTQGASIGIIPYPITCPNHWGCAPNKLWEYPSAGVPVLSTPSREIRALLMQYEFGWTISADPKAEEIALAVSRLSDKDLEKAKQNCQRFVKVSNWEVYSKDWLKHVESARQAN